MNEYGELAIRKLTKETDVPISRLRCEVFLQIGNNDLSVMVKMDGTLARY